jgi:hypothetical protein
MKERKIVEAKPATREECLQYVGGRIGRDFTSEEEKGLDGLLSQYSPDEVLGYFFGVVRDAEALDLTVNEYLIHKKRTVSGAIGTSIGNDELRIARANDKADEHEWSEIFKNSPDLYH